MDRLTYREFKEMNGFNANRIISWYKTIHSISSENLSKKELASANREYHILEKLVESNNETLEALYRVEDKLIPFDAGMRVKELKRLCRNNNLAVSGNKDTLIKRLFNAGIGNRKTNHPVMDKLIEFLNKVYPEIQGDGDELIKNCIDKFSVETRSEVLHKENLPILKMSMLDIEFDNDGNAWFDSSRASDFVGGKIKKGESPVMRWVETAEDGISRILKDRGLSQVVIYMGDINGMSEEEIIQLHLAKHNVFLKGFYDKATGKHFMCSAPSASSTRKADFPFVEADTYQDIYDLWCEITGYSTIEEVLDGIGKFEDGEYIVNFAKLKARIAMRGSNSFNTFDLCKNDVILQRLKNPNVDYTKDAVGTVNVPYKYISSPGVLTMKNGDSVEV